ncbi:QcrA and Rieske domain-containing protein [Halocalculus aciditolerans]|uniref:Rieske domain-containing protein n=1 Tax=Halocalculus aciditolerans TaxID=1383812 RepID=A0A830FQ91_9EURY|nr:ubiquinol-cytochrome c reductase iron-sulfur subunit [Halocalculus aciditolerans]GGL69778.1 hypothetical protein GCM10009039_29730 [Halocalculus aciditolerans]
MSADDTESEVETSVEPDGQTEQADEVPPSPDDTIRTTRRNAATFLAGVAGAAAIGSFAVSALTGVENAAVTGGRELTYKNIYTKGVHLVDEEGNRIKADAIEEGSGEMLTVFPEQEGGGALVTGKTTTLLLRFSEGDFQEPTNTDGTVQGYVAYSGVCTHAGCSVSQRSGPNNRNLHCPCHQSEFNPLQGCKVTGGPAPRPLPQLPIGFTEDGSLIMATGPFEGPIGVTE